VFTVPNDLCIAKPLRSLCCDRPCAHKFCWMPWLLARMIMAEVRVSQCICGSSPPPLLVVLASQMLSTLTSFRLDTPLTVARWTLSDHLYEKTGHWRTKRAEARSCSPEANVSAVRRDECSNLVGSHVDPCQKCHGFHVLLLFALAGCAFRRLRLWCCDAGRASDFQIP
jgi:hypothetical protein